MSKPFDREAAKAGAEVETIDGRKVRIVCFDRKHEHYPIIALVDEAEGGESIGSFTECGQIYLKSSSGSDLCMAPTHRVGYMGISAPYHQSGPIALTTYIYSTEEELLGLPRLNNEDFQVIKVEWEE